MHLSGDFLGCFINAASEFHKNSSMGDSMLGSVSESVLTHVQCAVMRLCPTVGACIRLAFDRSLNPNHHYASNTGSERVNVGAGVVCASTTTLSTLLFMMTISLRGTSIVTSPIILQKAHNSAHKIVL